MLSVEVKGLWEIMLVIHMLSPSFNQIKEII